MSSFSQKLNNSGQFIIAIREHERRLSVQKTNREVCEFWTKEYAKRQSSYNQVMRENSCKRANSY